jgi:predicted permease
MKILIVSLVLWIFVVPCAVALCLILISLSAMAPNVYLVLTGLAVAFATLAIIRGSLWTRRSSKDGSSLSSTNHQQLT